MTVGDFDSAQSLMPKIEYALENLPLEKSRRITLKNNVATLYFCVENYKLCLIWANKIIKDAKSTIKLELQRKARFFAMFSYIEIEEHFDEVDNLYRAAQRYFTKHGLKANIDVEFILLDYLLKYHKSPTHHKNAIVNQFKLTIESFQSDPIKRRTPGLEEFHFWARSKLEKRPMAQLIKESNGPGNKN